MKHVVSKIVKGERVSVLEDMTPEQETEFEAQRAAMRDADVPTTISDRQFAHALKKQGAITQAEALAFVQTGTIPSVLANIISSIKDQNDREDAELLISGAVEFHRKHPLTDAIGAAMGWTSEQVDDLWRTASEL